MSEREWADKNYYADLGVSDKATEAEIKKAYRKLARENHPDKNPGDLAAEERFKKAAEAYDVLGDPKKRKDYDELKAMLRSGGFGMGGRGGAGFPGGFRSSTGSHSGSFDFSDIFGGAEGEAGPGRGFSADGGFGDIFGGLFNRDGGAGEPSRPTRGMDIQTEVTLDFRDAVAGITVPLRITAGSACNECHGSGSLTGKTDTCSTCHGSGFENDSRGAFSFSRPCSRCKGEGTIITDPCPKCKATGVVRRQRNLRVRIPAGVTDGQKVRLAGQGEAGQNGKPAGDLFVTVHVRHDAVFNREGNDLEVTVPVSYAELALGDTITVPTLGDPVRVKIPSGTPDGRTLRVRGRGLRKDSKIGDLLVTLRVKVPEDMNEAAREALRAYAEVEREQGFDPRAGWAGARKFTS